MKRRLGHSIALRGALVSIVMLVSALFGLGVTGWNDHYVTHAASARPVVALTFDDGLNDQWTGAVADILDEHEARGTFFVIAQTLPMQEDLARDLVARGHLLANHSYDHTTASKFDLLYDQVPRAQAAFEATIGKCPRFYRPPHGVQTPFVNAAVHRAGMQTVLWDTEVADWSETDPERLADKVLAKVHAGSVVLLHDGSDGHRGSDRSVLIQALPMILNGLEERGLTPVTLDDLLGVSGYLPSCR